ncbi:MAG: hypothetical protein K2Y56_16745 [Methylobacterium sp.]|uniref:hypothetical protein n=1 Tax=Methylobacterium sp. TaxID=409 RepID=UPI0025EF3CA1|nr:hypothetical protein [Methylobacterium sp.]MBX9933158.1 hypothetical protein [Methylobacterium sp.]
MPDFIAALVSAILFCVAVILLNGATRLVIALGMAPADLAENGFVQYGLALAVAVIFWRRATRVSRATA